MGSCVRNQGLWLEVAEICGALWERGLAVLAPRGDSSSAETVPLHACLYRDKIALSFPLPRGGTGCQQLTPSALGVGL